MLHPLGSQWQGRGEVLCAQLDTQLLREGLSALTPSAAAWTDLCAYLDLLVTWNRKLDLTAASSTDELLDLVLTDALVLARFAAHGAHWVDVGAGAGAPGAVLAMLRADLSVTLVEPMQKRVAFLRALAGTLNNAKLRVERSRCEDLAPGGWDAAMSRATFEPAHWLADASGLAKHEIWLLLARSEAPQLAGWSVALDVAYTWPLGGAPRRALKYVRKIP